MIQVRRNFIGMLVIYIIYSAFAILYISNSINTYDDVSSKLLVIIAINFVVQNVIFFCYFRRIYLSIIFVWICYLFWLAKVFTVASGYVVFSEWWSINTFGIDSYVKATRYATIGVILVFAGCFCGLSVQSNRNVTRTSNSCDLTKNNVIPLLVITFAVTLYQTIITVYFAFHQGYNASHDVYFSDRFWYLLTRIFPIYFYFFLILNKDNKSRTKVYLLLFLFFETFQMLGGERAYPIIYIIVVTYLYFHTIEKIKIRYVLLSFSGAFLLLYFLIVVSSGRGSGAYDALALSFYDVVIKTMDEFGSTIHAIMKGFHDMTYHANGMSTLTSIVSIIPGWTRIFGTELLDKYYTFRAFDMNRFGSAFLIEYYFDYGYVGGLFATFIQGLLVGIIDKRISFNIQQEQNNKNVFYIFLMIELLFTIRSYPLRIPGFFVYFWLIKKANDWFISRISLKI